MLLHGLPSSGGNRRGWSLGGGASTNPSLCTAGMLNNVNRCVWKPVELRTGSPAGSPNLFFSPLIGLCCSPNALIRSICTLSRSECRDINLLSRAIRVQRLDVPSDVRFGVHTCFCIIIRFNGSKKKYILYVEAKSIWNVGCFMLQLTADGSIPKNASGPGEREALCNYNSLLFH